MRRRFINLIFLGISVALLLGCYTPVKPPPAEPHSLPDEFSDWWENDPNETIR